MEPHNYLQWKPWNLFPAHISWFFPAVFHFFSRYTQQFFFKVTLDFFFEFFQFLFEILPLWNCGTSHASGFRAKTVSVTHFWGANCLRRLGTHPVSPTKMYQAKSFTIIGLPFFLTIFHITIFFTMENGILSQFSERKTFYMSCFPWKKIVLGVSRIPLLKIVRLTVFNDCTHTLPIS